MKVHLLALLVIAPALAQIEPPNVITTVAGNGASGFDGNTGQPPGGAIRFAGISSIIRDSSGNWIVADYGNNRVRRLSPDFSVAATLVGTGTFTTVSITGKPTEVSVWGPVALAFANQEHVPLARS